MKYQKKPIKTEALNFNGRNVGDIVAFTQGKATRTINETVIIIKTLEGEVVANAGDWIIKGVKGEFYPCKPDIFEQTYEAVSD